MLICKLFFMWKYCFFKNIFHSPECPFSIVRMRFYAPKQPPPFTSDGTHVRYTISIGRLHFNWHIFRKMAWRYPRYRATFLNIRIADRTGGRCVCHASPHPTLLFGRLATNGNQGYVYSPAKIHIYIIVLICTWIWVYNLSICFCGVDLWYKPEPF